MKSSIKTAIAPALACAACVAAAPAWAERPANLAGTLDMGSDRGRVRNDLVLEARVELHMADLVDELGGILVAVSGIALAWLTYSRRVISADLLAAIFAPIRRAALARFWLDDLFEGLYRGALLGMSAAVGWVDRYLVDGVVNVLSAWTLTGGDRLRRMQSGLPQDYVYGLVVGLLLLLIWVQWPR